MYTHAHVNPPTHTQTHTHTKKKNHCRHTYIDIFGYISSRSPQASHIICILARNLCTYIQNDVYMYMYMYIYIYIHTYIHTYIYIYTYVHTNIPGCPAARIYILTFAYTRAGVLASGLSVSDEKPSCSGFRTMRSRIWRNPGPPGQLTEFRVHGFLCISVSITYTKGAISRVSDSVFETSGFEVRDYSGESPFTLD